MRRIWILTELYFPERTSTAYFLTQIAQGLVKDYEVQVISGASMYETQTASLPKLEIVNQVAIHRCEGTHFDKNWLPGRILNGLTRSIAIFLKALQKCRSTDVILVVTNPPLLPVMALLLKCLKGCDFVLLVHDVYPEVLTAIEFLSAQNPLYWMMQTVNSWVYRNARYIVTLGRDMTQLVQAKLPSAQPLTSQNIVCIPNWAEIESIYPIDWSANSLLQRLNLTDKFVVLYAGNMGRTHDLQILLDAAKTLLTEQSSIHFLCIGSGASKSFLGTQVKAQALTNVTVLNYLPNSERNLVLNACDIGVISFLPGMAGISVPSRMYNQMAAGKPILAISDHWSELASVVEEEAIGWVVEPRNSERLLTVLRTALQQPEKCAAMGQRAAIAVHRKYTLAHAEAAYLALFNELMMPVQCALQPPDRAQHIPGN
jgi:colanic acid biosynthesis glycosyl transferase WcaI